MSRATVRALLAAAEPTVRLPLLGRKLKFKLRRVNPLGVLAEFPGLTLEVILNQAAESTPELARIGTSAFSPALSGFLSTLAEKSLLRPSMKELSDGFRAYGEKIPVSFLFTLLDWQITEFVNATERDTARYQEVHDARRRF